MSQQHQRSWYSLPQLFRLMLLGTVIAGVVSLFRPSHLSGLVQGACGWIEDFGAWAPLVFIVLYNLGTLLCIPGSVLTAKGGLLFGLVWGSIYVLIAAIFGAVLSFGLGRYYCRAWVARIMDTHPRLQSLDAAIAQQSWKFVFLTRLSPLFPFNLTNYAFGVTQISLKDYVIGSLGILPGTIMYTYMGTLVGELSLAPMSTQLANPEMQRIHWGMRVAGLLATIGVTVYLSRISRRVLTQRLPSAKG